MTSYAEKECSRRLLPPILKTRDGRAITTAEEWRSIRRPELVALFEEHMYGRIPGTARDARLTCRVSHEKYGLADGLCDRKLVTLTPEGNGGSCNLRCLIFLPAKRQRPVPLFLVISCWEDLMWDVDMSKDDPNFPVRRILQRGYGAAIIRVSDADPDMHDEFHNGVHGVFGPFDKPYPRDAWGTISAWAWAASRAMDYLTGDSDIDGNRVVLNGCSRCGKTALWCSALDERFAMVAANVSGCGGAAVERGKTGERIADITRDYPHWFCGRYQTYSHREAALPIDQHMLLALTAPRPLYIASAETDDHADPASEYLSCLFRLSQNEQRKGSQKREKVV